MTNRLLCLTLATIGILAAQDPPSRAGRLSFVSGAVSFEPAGANDWEDATINRPLTVGDQLYADNGGRAEVHVPGTAFHLGSRTAFEFLNLDDQNVQVRLSEGSLNLRVRRLEGNLEIDAPNLAFNVQQPGEYRIDTDPDNNQSNVTVRSGGGQVTTNAGSFPVAAGQEGVITGQDQVQYAIYAAPGADDFDNWVVSRDRREDHRESARYVSPSVVGYEDLDDYGRWQSTSDNGEMWVPNNVAGDWAPYHDGHWAWIDPWGWSWVDDAPWGFAPFHYGRWAYFGGRWGWCPGPVAVTPVYAPALVAWFGVGAGGFNLSIGINDGVGWFPLGPRDVYIPAYQSSAAYVTRINVTNTTVINNVQVTNVYNNYVKTGSVPIASYTNRMAPNAVVAVPRDAMASGRPVHQVAVKVTSNQVASIKSVTAVPRVVPQQGAVLGPSAAQHRNVAKPAAAVLSRAIVAKTTPPPRPAPVQQRLAAVAKNNGRPAPMQQLHQMAQSAPAAAHPAVHVVTQARQVKPPVQNQPGPRAIPGAAVGQHPTAPTPVPNQARPEQQRPAPPSQPNRPVEPPTAQQRRAEPQAQPSRPAEAPREQPHVQPQPNRPAEPAPTPERRAQPQARPVPAPREEPRAQPRQETPPPAEQRRAEPPPRPQERQVTPPPREQARPATPPPREQARPATPPPREQARPATPPPREQARPATPPSHEQARPAPRPAPTQEKPKSTEKKKDEKQP